MSQPFLGEIRMFGFAFPPRGWAFCNGQLLAINTNTALFSILGTTYGGNGTTTFQLPNLQSRIPLHFGTGPGLSPRAEGQVGGEENHTLTIGETPMHNHIPILASTGDPNQGAAGGFWPKRASGYATTTPTTPLHPAALATVGGQPHTNLAPYLVVNFCIALQGTFPSRN
jgi:microcystin-dependent protein